jgi:hypothetical protein
VPVLPSPFLPHVLTFLLGNRGGGAPPNPPLHLPSWASAKSFSSLTNQGSKSSSPCPLSFLTYSHFRTWNFEGAPHQLTAQTPPCTFKRAICSSSIFETPFIHSGHCSFCGSCNESLSLVGAALSYTERDVRRRGTVQCAAGKKLAERKGGAGGAGGRGGAGPRECEPDDSACPN